MLEFGTSKTSARPFLFPALEKSKAVIRARFATALDKVIDRAAKTLSVTNKGELFKEYPLVALELPSSARGKDPVATQVKEKVALKGSERVAFGGRDYAGSERWILLGLTNAIIRSAATDGSAPPPGIIVSQEDIEEIFPLVARGTSVTIR